MQNIYMPHLVSMFLGLTGTRALPVLLLLLLGPEGVGVLKTVVAGSVRTLWF